MEFISPHFWTNSGIRFFIYFYFFQSTFSNLIVTRGRKNAPWVLSPVRKSDLQRSASFTHTPTKKEKEMKSISGIFSTDGKRFEYLISALYTRWRLEKFFLSLFFIYFFFFQREIVQGRRKRTFGSFMYRKEKKKETVNK